MSTAQANVLKKYFYKGESLMKRTTALILALLMCVSMMPNVFAFTPETVESAAETVPGSESAALAVSNDAAVLGDNYLVDGLGKALLCQR